MNLRTIAVLGLGLLLVASLARQAKAQSDSAEEVLTEGAAAKLLAQMADGLQGHSARKMLGAFDLSRMDDGPLFKEQITAFFNQYETIRVHFKLVEVKENTAIVDAEMDATPPSSADPPQHKNLQLRLSAAKTPAGWKFVDLQPRNFFTA